MENNQTQSEPASAELPSPEGLSSSALLALKRRLFEAAKEVEIHDGFFMGCKVKVLTEPLPYGCVGLFGSTPEDAVFIVAND